MSEQTPLQIITSAYDKAGVSYVVRKNENYFYLVLCDKSRKDEFQKMGFNQFISRGFIEFYPDERIASY